MSLDLPSRVDSGAADLLIVGGGTAGLAAAVAAAQAGGRVTILEGADRLGGTLFISAGQMSAAGTRLQRALGIVDTPQAHVDDIMRISAGTADRAVVELAARHAAELYDWLESCGFSAEPACPVVGVDGEPYAQRRFVWGQDAGRSILKVLLAQLKPHLASGQVTAMLATRATRLLTDGATGAARVIGAEAQRDGVTVRHRARDTLLATGGYTANVALTEALTGQEQPAVMSCPGAQGDGLRMALELGAWVRGRENVISRFGAILESDAKPSRAVATFESYPERRAPWEIYVNAAGRRFMREDQPGIGARSRALQEQPRQRCWIVFDQAILEQAPAGVRGWTRAQVEAAFDTHAMFTRAPSLAALASACGLDGEGLQATVTRYNHFRQRGEDADFGRAHMPAPIAAAPFYAIRQQAFATTSAMGLAVDGELRVLDEARRPIAGLYAAGEILGAGALMGRAFCGGMMLTPALTFGRLLGGTLVGDRAGHPREGASRMGHERT